MGLFRKSPPPPPRTNNRLHQLIKIFENKIKNTNLKTQLRRIHTTMKNTHGSNNRSDKLRFSESLRNLNKLINSI